MKLILIRHGKTDWNSKNLVQGWADPPLNRKGIKQAKRLAKYITKKYKNINFKWIYSTPLERGLRTAQILKKKLQSKFGREIQLIVREELKSRNLGVFSGKTLDYIKENYFDLYKEWISGDMSFIPPQGESNIDFFNRINKFINYLKENHDKTDNILIVTHRENIGVIHYLITKTRFKAPLKSVKNCMPVVVNLE
ncbi:MAG: histidine phosphatase family protein [Promethearchaeota archaeon]